MLNNPSRKFKHSRKLLIQLCASVLERADAQALMDLVRDLAFRVHCYDRTLTQKEREALEAVKDVKPYRAPNSPPPIDDLPPLKGKQLELFILLSRAGPRGLATKTIITRLWPGEPINTVTRRRLRKLQFDANAILRKYDSGRRLIWRPIRALLAIKTLLKMLPI